MFDNSALNIKAQGFTASKSKDIVDYRRVIHMFYNKVLITKKTTEKIDRQERVYNNDQCY